MRSQGYTNWNPPTLGASRATFLKEAVSRVYEEKVVQRRSSLSSTGSFSNLPRTTSPQSIPSNSVNSPDLSLASRQRYAKHAAEIRAKKQDPNYKKIPVSEERPISNYQDVLSKLEVATSSTENAPPVPKLPSIASKFLRGRRKDSKNSQKNVSASSSISPHAAMLSSEKLPLKPDIQVDVHVPTGPQVRDPVDVAVEKLTAMGFDEARAKKALAETDSGNSVNFERAVELLVRERERKKLQGRLARMG